MSTLNRFCVLYVDHDMDSCEVLASFLHFYEITVTCVSTVREARDLAHPNSFDLFLLANRFADGDGLELCRELRAMIPQTPVAFYSGDAHEADRVAGLSAGAIAYIEKPNFDAIVSLIKKVTDGRPVPNPSTAASGQLDFAQIHCRT